jgi:hypothetical protein
MVPTRAAVATGITIAAEVALNAWQGTRDRTRAAHWKQ